MVSTTIQTAFVSGELSPALYGRTDLAKYHTGASTMRNFFPSYRGGASSRAGTAYVGTCKQVGTAYPPRDIPFQFSINQGYALEFGDQYMRIKANGAYVVEAAKTISAATKADPAVITATAHGYSNGDWVFISGMGGMTNFNGLTWIVVNKTTDTFQVTDLFGNTINSTSFSTYTSGGTAERIYTVVSPYAAVDLPYLKYTQSADTMSLGCYNQVTFTEYPPYDLQRVAATNWTFTATTFGASIAAPTGVTIVATNSTTVSTWYSYVVTAVDATTGDESVASARVNVENNDISINAGSNTLTWTRRNGASNYNVYRTTPSYGVAVPIGANYGYLGTTLGLSFTDTNIIADFSTTPPQHKDPFARGQITAVVPTAPGSGYVQSTITYSVTTSTGTGFSGTPIVSATGTFVGFIVVNPGKNYAPADTITIATGGTGATATLTIGARTGTYPGVPAYFEQRRMYANTINEPDTYWGSQPGAFLNMDSSIPLIGSDALVGAPWAQQINGIQAMVPMPGGLVVLTGKGAWQVNGVNNTALTPMDQAATPQGYNGCHNRIQPIPINSDILYVQSKGSVIRDLTYNFYNNIYTGNDITLFSSHLFSNHQLVQWTYAEEPFKLIWAVRDDGILLSVTWLKEQDVYGIARHDTNGLYQCACSIVEPPGDGEEAYVDAVYLIVKRYVQGAWRYYSERMDDRNWMNVEDSWCVDAGLAWPMSFPNATLTASAATGTATFTASSSVFVAGDVGSVIRLGGGKATVTAYTSGTVVTGLFTQDMTSLIPDDPNELPTPAMSGDWSITPTTSVVTGLNHLEGLEVAILADGSVVAKQTVVDGSITLPQAYSAIVVGLSYTCQLQSLYLDPVGGPETVQGKRKNIGSVSIRCESTRGLKVGSNQPDAATQPNGAIVPWSGLIEIKQRNSLILPGKPIPLFTGDQYINIPTSWNVKGQIAVQQDYPLPANILAFIPNFVLGDT